jgi:putative addiction module component (TIGR02574 family)
MPPPGFDDLAVDEKIDYVQSLWDRIAVSEGELPLRAWQREVLDERLAAHRASPHEAKPWKDVLDELERRLKTR